MHRYLEGVPAAASVPATEAAKQVLARADAAMGFQNQCGLSRVSQVKCQYTSDGRLWETNKYGVYEVYMCTCCRSSGWFAALGSMRQMHAVCAAHTCKTC